MKYKLPILYLLFLVGCATSSRIPTPRKITAEGDFIHTPSGIKYPGIFRQFHRKDLISFDDKNQNVAATYEAPLNDAVVSFTVYVYPADEAYEDRLRHEYLESLQSIATAAHKEIVADQYPLPYSKDGFRVIGLTAALKETPNPTALTLFECGKWFLKFRITSTSFGTIALDSLRNDLIDFFSPTDIVQRNPLQQKGDVIVAPAAFQDSVLLHATLKAAFKKLAWVRNNVDSLERSAGFPSLYLAGHTYPILEMIQDWEESKQARDPSTDEYFRSLQTIRDAGFINEFVMHEYQFLLLPPDSLQLDFTRFEEWKRTHSPNVSLHKRYFIVGYKE